MGFFRNLFGGLLGGKSEPNDRGVYGYVKILRSGEIVPVRMLPGYDISEHDDGQYFARKMVMGTYSFEQIEAVFYLDGKFRIINAEISQGGQLSDEAAYLAQQNRDDAATKP